MIKYGAVVGGDIPDGAKEKLEDWFQDPEAFVDVWVDTDTVHAVVYQRAEQWGFPIMTGVRIFTIGEKWELSQDWQRRTLP